MGALTRHVVTAAALLLLASGLPARGGPGPRRELRQVRGYERYTIRDGVWRQHPVGDPGPWVRGAALALWPMLTGGNEPSSTAVQDMWRSRDTIGDLLLAEARAHGYPGYCLDVEGHADTTTRATFLSLVSYLAGRLHAEERRLMVATATWSTIAPFGDLARTSADYVASMDPYTSLWRSYIPANYASVEPARRRVVRLIDAIAIDLSFKPACDARPWRKARRRRHSRRC